MWKQIAPDASYLHMRAVWPMRQQSLSWISILWAVVISLNGKVSVKSRSAKIWVGISAAFSLISMTRNKRSTQGGWLSSWHIDGWRDIARMKPRPAHSLNWSLASKTCWKVMKWNYEKCIYQYTGQELRYCFFGRSWGNLLNTLASRYYIKE